MRAQRVADKPGSYPAPRSFVEMLRRETRCPRLDCWFDPTVPVMDGERVPEHRRGTLGCWVVWDRTRILDHISVGNIVFGVSRSLYTDIFILNGLHDHPLDLGFWVAQELNRCDLRKRGGRARLIRLDDAREAQVLMADDQSTATARDMAHDSFIQKRLTKTIEDTGGFKSVLKEEAVAQEKELYRVFTSRRKRLEGRAKSSRVYG